MAAKKKRPAKAKAKPAEKWHGAPALRPLLASITELKPDPKNARRHGKRNLKSIAASIERFGQQKAIVVDANGVIRAGNGTLEAARSLGWTHLARVVSDLKGREADAFALADNRTAELAEWDEPVLADMLKDLDEELRQAAGFNANEFAKLAGQAAVIEDEPPPMGDVEYRLIVKTAGEADQSALLERLESEGYECLPLMS